ncbi:MAG: glycosyl hydrolase 53 family protein [Bacteroidota bacterium]
MMNRISLLLIALLACEVSLAQSPFYLGADFSYVNEMEDCGVRYYESQEAKDPYAIFNDRGCNLARLRLWHSPAWYDQLNEGRRYSDLADVKRSIARAQAQGMEVLLDFHLSDTWADPSSQLVPEAWLPVVNDLEVLKDSLYQYIYRTLEELEANQLLPEMVQIGNETNKGILLSPQDNAVWTLDWDRNAALFNHAIKAVRDFEAQVGKRIKVVLHLAGPDNAEWLLDGFANNGVSDFDIIGLSYYWAWHMPTTIEETGALISTLRQLYNKEVLIVETGYIWTTEWNDTANNIISETHPDYHPASPNNQRDWLIALTREVAARDGLGVLYWEPCWVSSPCFTQWGQGSHQEHAAFFDFDNQLLVPGGIEWMSQDYGQTTSQGPLPLPALEVQIMANSFSGDVKIKQHTDQNQVLDYSVMDTMGQVLLSGQFEGAEVQFQLSDLPFGLYLIEVRNAKRMVKTKKMIYGKS